MKEIKLLAAAGIGAVAVALASCSTANQEWHNNCRVTDKDILSSVSSDGKGNVSTSRTKRLSTSCGPFDVSDSMVGGFKSWDTWQALEVGKAYDIRTGGYRAGWLDQFPTVLEIKARP